MTATTITVEGISGSAYRVSIGGHQVVVDQPLEGGGHDLGPTPTDLFVAGLASCTAFYAGKFLQRRDIQTENLRVTCDYTMTHSRPSRVESIRLVLDLPGGLSDDERAATLRAADQCSVHHSLQNNPDVAITLSSNAPAVAGRTS